MCGTEETLCEILNNIWDIDNYTIVKGKQADMCSAVIRTSAEADIRKELFYRLASADMPIMQLGIFEKSLEDVFWSLQEKRLKLPGKVQREPNTKQRKRLAMHRQKNCQKTKLPKNQSRKQRKRV